jgi:hypothetical protein
MARGFQTRVDDVGDNIQTRVDDVVDNICEALLEGGLYPVLFLDYIQQLLGGEGELPFLWRFALGTALIGVTCVINVYGLEMVASAGAYTHSDFSST